MRSGDPADPQRGQRMPGTKRFKYNPIGLTVSRDGASISDIIERLRFDAARCELHFSKGIAGNIEEATAEIKRLRNLLEVAVDLLCGATSGHIGGSQPDCEWDARKERLLRDYADLGRGQAAHQ